MNHSHDSLVIHKDVTAVSCTGNGLAHALVHDFGGQVLAPALPAEAVATL